MSEASEEVKATFVLTKSGNLCSTNFKLCSNIRFNIKSRSGFNIYWFAILKKNIS